jgi:hypothetical protein
MIAGSHRDHLWNLLGSLHVLQTRHDHHHHRLLFRGRTLLELS